VPDLLKTGAFITSRVKACRPYPHPCIQNLFWDRFQKPLILENQLSPNKSNPQNYAINAFM